MNQNYIMLKRLVVENYRSSVHTSLNFPPTASSIESGRPMRKKMDSVCAIGLLPVAVMGLIMAGNAAADEGQPTIAKDWVQITAYTFNVYHKNFDVWSWVPRAEYRVNGPIVRLQDG